MGELKPHIPEKNLGISSPTKGKDPLDGLRRRNMLKSALVAAAELKDCTGRNIVVKPNGDSFSVQSRGDPTEHPQIIFSNRRRNTKIP